MFIVRTLNAKLRLGSVVTFAQKNIIIIKQQEFVNYKMFLMKLSYGFQISTNCWNSLSNNLMGRFKLLVNKLRKLFPP